MREINVHGGIVRGVRRNDQSAVHRKKRIVLRRRADALPGIGSVQERNNHLRRVVHRRVDVRDPLRIARTQIEIRNDSAAIDMAIRNYAGAARQIEPKRCAGKRHHAIVESGRIASQAPCLHCPPPQWRPRRADRRFRHSRCPVPNRKLLPLAISSTCSDDRGK